jgi:hypothetical protein
MSSDLKLPFFDPDYCLKVARWSSAACIAWLFIELLLLAVLDPQSGSCSQWVIFPGKPSETHVGFLVLVFRLCRLLGYASLPFDGDGPQKKYSTAFWNALI